MALKWGIAGAGKISTQFVKSVSVLPWEEQQVVAVAAQSLERAQSFAKELNIGKAYGDYMSLAEDGEVDVVYVGNLNSQHFQVSKLMLQHGKHVLCEKPLTLNEKQTRALIEFARSKNLFLMEAIWSRCFPAYEKLQFLIKSGAIGDVLYVQASFGRKFPYIERLVSKEFGGGVILDLGVYTLQIAQMIFEGVEPLSCVATGKLNEQGVDECASVLISYPHGRIACVTTHSQIDLPNEAVICGTNGIIKVPRFWAPTILVTPGSTLDFELPPTKGVQFKHFYSVGMSYEAQEVKKCILAGLLESPKMTHKESLQLAKLMDKIRQDVGVVFEEDNMDW